jgi:uncharacterized cysteine cluster protein YcgN (CxxCxxCC family)
VIRSKKYNSEEYKLLSRKIDGLRAYNERIKQIPEALKLQKEGVKRKGWVFKYVYNNNPDDLFKRLELFCGERDISNDSVEVRNEIVSILDLLLKKNAILKNIIYYRVNGVNNFMF